MVKFEEIISEDRIDLMVKDTAYKIYEQCLSANITTLDVLIIANGGLFFGIDLIREIQKLGIHTNMEIIRFSSYFNTIQTDPVNTFMPKIEYAEKAVLIIDDIFDTGNTLRETVRIVKEHTPKMIMIATAVTKNEKTINIDGVVHFPGLVIGNQFVVGYGLDFNGLYRDLPYIAYISNSGI